MKRVAKITYKGRNADVVVSVKLVGHGLNPRETSDALVSVCNGTMRALEGARFVNAELSKIKVSKR